MFERWVNGPKKKKKRVKQNTRIQCSEISHFLSLLSDSIIFISYSAPVLSARVINIFPLTVPSLITELKRISHMTRYVN